MKLTLSTTHSNRLFRPKSHISSGIHLTHNPYHIVGYINCGTKRIQIGNHIEEIGQGDIYYLGNGNYYNEEIICPKRGLFDQTIFVFTNELMRTISKHVLTFAKVDPPRKVRSRSINSRMVSHESACAEIREFMREVNGYLRRHSSQEYGSSPLNQIKFYGLILLLMTCENSLLRPHIYSPTLLRSNNIAEIVRANLFTPTKVDELAALCNLTPSSFKRNFASLFGDSPHRWINSQRLAHARTLLCSPNISIKTISNRSGFVSESHFIRLFKSQYGTTPANYRRQYLADELK